jgi:hypothetical protein
LFRGKLLEAFKRARTIIVMGSGKAIMYAFFFALGVWLMLSGYTADTGQELIPGFATMSASTIFSAGEATGGAFVQSGAFIVFLIILLSVFSGGKKKYKQY